MQLIIARTLSTTAPAWEARFTRSACAKSSLPWNPAVRREDLRMGYNTGVKSGITQATQEERCWTFA